MIAHDEVAFGGDDRGSQREPVAEFVGNIAFVHRLAVENDGAFADLTNGTINSILTGAFKE